MKKTTTTNSEPKKTRTYKKRSAQSKTPKLDGLHLYEICVTDTYGNNPETYYIASITRLDDPTEGTSISDDLIAAYEDKHPTLSASAILLWNEIEELPKNVTPVTINGSRPEFTYNR